MIVVALLAAALVVLIWVLSSHAPEEVEESDYLRALERVWRQ